MFYHDPNCRQGKIGRLLVFVLLIVLIVGGLYVFMQPGRIKIEVAFSEVRDLRVGAPVIVNNATVGTVSRIRKDSDDSIVTLAIKAPAAKSINAPPDCAARLVTAQGNRPTHIEIVNRGAGRESLAQNGRIEALESKVSEAVFLGANKAEEALDGARRGMGKIADTVRSKVDDAKDWTKGEEAEKMKERVEEIRTDLEDQIEEGGENTKEALGKALDRGKELGEDLRRYGREDLLPQLEEMMNEVKKKAAELSEKKEEEKKN